MCKYVNPLIQVPFHPVQLWPLHPLSFSLIYVQFTLRMWVCIIYIDADEDVFILLHPYRAPAATVVLISKLSFTICSLSPSLPFPHTLSLILSLSHSVMNRIQQMDAFENQIIYSHTFFYIIFYVCSHSRWCDRKFNINPKEKLFIVNKNND